MLDGQLIEINRVRRVKEPGVVERGRRIRDRCDCRVGDDTTHFNRRQIDDQLFRRRVARRGRSPAAVKDVLLLLAQHGDAAVQVRDGRGKDFDVLPGRIEGELQFGRLLLAVVGEDLLLDGVRHAPAVGVFDHVAVALTETVHVGVLKLVLAEDRTRALRRLDALDALAQVEILLGGHLDGVNRETAPGGQHTVLHLEGALEFVRSLLRNLLGQEQRLTQRTFELQGQRLVHARGRRDVERIATLLKGRVAFQQPVRRT